MPSAPPTGEVSIDDLRRLITAASPDPEAARPVLDCGEDEPLDALMPFSSLILLGVVVAIEDRYQVRVTRAALDEVGAGGVTLRKLAQLVAALPSGRGPAP
jgi:hypothetical protein